MRRAIHLIIYIIAIAFSFACTSKHEDNEDASVAEAESFVKETNSIDALSDYADSLSKASNYRAEIIVREALGKVFRDQCDFEQAFIQHDSAIALARLEKDTIHLVRALNQQGTNFRRVGDMEEASKLHYQALELCDDNSSDTSYVARKNRVVSLNGLGNILLSMGNYEEAGKVFRKALAGEKSLGSPVGQAINYANIGSIFEHQNMLDSAHIYYDLSMKMNSKADNATGIGLCYQYIGRLDEKQGNIETARQNFLKSYEVLVPTGDSWHWLEASIALSKLYLQTSNADSARKYIDITYTTAKSIRSKEHTATAYSLCSQFEEKWGVPSRALELYKLSKALNDSLLSEKDYNHMQNLRVNYEAKRRSAEVKKAQREAKFEQYMRKVITWIGIIGFIVMSGVVANLIYTNRIRKKSNIALQNANEAMKQADEELRKADAELRLADEELRKADSERQAFYRDIAHRFRTPLTVVIGMTQQLQEHINKDDEQALGDFKAVERQNGELLRLVNEMMHKLQPNATTATVTSIDGELQYGNITDDEPDLSDEKNTEATEAVLNSDGTKPLILLAEDNEDVARYQCELLERNGYRVNWAEDGVMALELIKEEMPKLIITDIMMPHMDGLELCRNIRNNPDTTHLPLIVVTARVEDRDRMKGLEAGAEVYLTKPFLGRELLLNIKNLLNQRERLRKKFTDVASTAAGGTDELTLDAQSITPLQNSNDTDIEQLTRDKNPSEEQTDRDSKFQQMVNEVIDSNLSDTEFSSTILAAHICLSRAQLNRKINTEFGTDTSHYIRERRLEHACRMLRTTNMTIMDIQISCGFESPGYFSRVFKQRFDLSPSEYRKSNKA